jgi:hypothetical protein
VADPYGAAASLSVFADLDSAPPMPVAAPPLPYRGGPTAAQRAAPPSLRSTATAGEVAQKLLHETDAALARHTLLQVASLPDQAPGAPRQMQPQGAHWMFEVPLMMRGGTSIAQFEIGRDHAATADGRIIWRARFSVDIEPVGPVHAQVALLGGRAAVTLWAERPGTAASLRESAPLLADALRDAALEPGDIECRLGQPPKPRLAAPAGRFLDFAS